MTRKTASLAAEWLITLLLHAVVIWSLIHFVAASMVVVNWIEIQSGPSIAGFWSVSLVTLLGSLFLTFSVSHGYRTSRTHTPPRYLLAALATLIGVITLLEMRPVLAEVHHVSDIEHTKRHGAR